VCVCANVVLSQEAIDVMKMIAIVQKTRSIIIIIILFLIKICILYVSIDLFLQMMAGIFSVFFSLVM